jgi:dipeptidase D
MPGSPPPTPWRHRTRLALLLGALRLATACTEPTADLGPALPEGDATQPCRDMASFRARLLQSVDDTDRSIIEAWYPPRPVTRAARPFVESLARRYMKECGGAETVTLTQQLIAFATVSTQQSPHDGADFKAMAAFLREWSRKAGLRFDVFGSNDAWEITYGAGPRNLAFLVHGDVVPPGAGWARPPFKAEVLDGKLYGRGAEDDKGPLAAVLVAMHTLAATGLPPPGRLTTIIGTGEENDWIGMERYVRNTPRARTTLSLDADFPVTVAENGSVAWHLGAPMSGTTARPTRPRILEARAGDFLTQVPSSATAVIKPGVGGNVAALLARLRDVAEAELRGRRPHAPVAVETRLNEAKNVVITVVGKAVHASVASQGKNPLFPLARILLRLDPQPNGAALVMRVLRDLLESDDEGRALGLSYGDALMGKLLVVPTVLRVQEALCTLDINMRRPRGRSNAEFNALLDEALKVAQRKVDSRLIEYAPRNVGDPVVSTAPDSLVRTLMQIYGAETGDSEAQPVSIRSGTYARIFPGAVSFGPVRRADATHAHQPDEFIDVGELQALGRMYLEAILRLQGDAQR